MPRRVAIVFALGFASLDAACSAPSPSPPTPSPAVAAADPCAVQLARLRTLLDAGKLHRALAVLAVSRCPTSATAPLRAEAETALAEPIAGAGADAAATIAAGVALVQTSVGEQATRPAVAQRNFDRAIAALERATGAALVLETGHVNGPSRDAATPDGRFAALYNLGLLALYDGAAPRYFYSTHLDCGPPQVTFSDDGTTMVWKDCDTIHFTDVTRGIDRRTITTKASVTNLYLSDDARWLVATGTPTLAWQLDRSSASPRELAASGDVVALISSKQLVVFHASGLSDRQGPRGEPIEERVLVSVDLATGRKRKEVATKGTVVGGGRTRGDGRFTLFDGEHHLLTYDAATLGLLERRARPADECAAWAEVTRFVPLECERAAISGRALRPDAIAFAGDVVAALSVGAKPTSGVIERWSSQGARTVPGGAYVVFSRSAKLAAAFDSAGLPAVEESALYGPTDPHPAPLRELRIVDVTTGKQIRTIAVTDCAPRGAHAPPEIRFSPDDRFLAYHCGDLAVRLHDLASGERKLLAGHGDKLSAIAFSHNGATLASGADDHRVRLWDTATGKLISSQDTGEAINGIAFSPDDRELATAHGDLVVWNLPGWTRRRTVPSDKYLLAEDGALLLEGPKPADGGAWWWVGALAPVWHGAVELHPKPPRAVAPGGGTVVAQDAIRGMILWRTSDGATLATLASYGAHALFVDTARGYVDLIGDAKWDDVASCRIGHLALPFAACQERFHVPGLLAKLIAGDESYTAP